MAALDTAAASSHGKQRRRRRPDKPPVSAKLVLDDAIESDTGILSGPLFADLFPHLRATDSEDVKTARTHYVAIAPWSPNVSPSDSAWSIVPVKPYSSEGVSRVQFSPSSPALQAFAATLQQVAPSRLPGYGRSGIDIFVLDVAPLPLETVFVSLESNSTKRLEYGEETLYGTRVSHLENKQTCDIGPKERLATAIRTSLASLEVVHEGDLFPLPLSSHQVTLVLPSPGRIALCEPVAQGTLTEATKVVVMRGRTRTRQARGQISMAPSHGRDEDAQTDQFFSAAEERHRCDTDAHADESGTEIEAEVDDELSDDSMDDLISLQAPALPPTTSKTGMGTGQAGSPTTVSTMRGRRTNGAATPGSVFSNMTCSTDRPDRPRGRLFKAQGLLQPIPSHLLHPRPASEEDEEARIYVETSTLPKVGCFSGDWAQVEVAEEPPLNGFGAFGPGNFGQAGPEERKWRPVRVYGLPECYSQRPVTRIPSSKEAGPSISFFNAQVQTSANPVAHASPILLANLDNSTFLRISPLKKPPYQGKGTLPRFTSASHPPYAKEISIHYIRSPLSAERAYQTAVLGSLKRYFARKIRLVRTDDLIAMPVDAHLGRVFQEWSVSSGGSEIDDVMELTVGHGTNWSQSPNVDAVAWFKVGHIRLQRCGEDEDGSTETCWGSVSCIDSSTVGMHGTGFETSRIPAGSESTWPYYLGLKRASLPCADGRGPGPRLFERKPQFISPLRRQLRELVAAATSPRAIQLKMPSIAVLLTSSHRNLGKSTLARNACADGGLHTYVIDAYDILSEGGGSGGDVKTEGFLRTRADRAMSCGPDCCALLIQHIEALTADRIELTMRDMVKEVRVLLATTSEVDRVPDGVRAIFTHELDVGAPGEAEREAILRTIVDDRGLRLEPGLELASVALRTAALVAGDLVDVVERASAAQRARLEHLSARASSDGSIVTVRDVQVAGGASAWCLTCADFDVAVEAARKNLSDSIGAPKIPNVTWDDVGGLSQVKEAVADTIQLPLERPELFAKGMKKRSGILFYGPPGTGKTLLAKAIATEYSLNFFSVKGPELLNMYIGESEANVRRVFQRARDARPCVVFFDELDSVAPKRGNQGDSGGVMDRIVSQLLAELDGMSGGGDEAGGVFFIGATNRPDLLDPALLRPGRFDKMLYLGVCETHEKQLAILEALTRKFTLDPSVSLRAVAERLPLTYTGADFYALCSDAMLKAVTRRAAAVDARIQALNANRAVAISTASYFDHYATAEDVAVTVTEADFLAAQGELVPSVSAGELAHYERVRAAFEDRRCTDAAAAASNSSNSLAGASRHGQVRLQGKGGAKSKGKGKGKAVAWTTDDEADVDNEASDKEEAAVRVMGFQDGTASDDGLY